MLKELTAAAALLTLVACAGTKTQTTEDAPAVEAAPAADASSEAGVKMVEQAEGEAQVFGATFSTEGYTKVGDALANPMAYADKTLVLGGEIRQVCQKMGCWFELAPGPDVAQAVRVTSPGHDILIPKDSSGKMAFAKGQLVVREVSEDEAEHYRSEGAAAEAGMELTLKMTGVIIK